ncbi:hypothetical protein [Allosphingosinicella indica]|uniref:Integron n=1 Tax=Allosphingosinicella indica TaxID=941907 RepID=A0A1X7FZR6_9SPHN|nr:hypothetical protein [Allosphingosinicella indica]SMF61581.1 hypothetical protein SAMN06295910_0573 [Allosphingosinicella indica]
MRGLLLLLPLLAAGCQERSDIDTSRGSTTPAYERVENAAIDEGGLETPVRVGESGPSFPACTARGTTRRLAEGQGLAVRAAPFEGAGQVAELPAGASFFVCTRSIDQRWLGVVFDDAGAASPACGVSRPVADRRAYDGPCRAGWVASASVRLTAG